MKNGKSFALKKKFLKQLMTRKEFCLEGDFFAENSLSLLKRKTNTREGLAFIMLIVDA
jgi:hypothetical protein